MSEAYQIIEKKETQRLAAFVAEHGRRFFLHGPGGPGGRAFAVLTGADKAVLPSVRPAFSGRFADARGLADRRSSPLSASAAEFEADREYSSSTWTVCASARITSSWPLGWTHGAKSTFWA